MRVKKAVLGVSLIGALLLIVTTAFAATPTPPRRAAP